MTVLLDASALVALHTASPAAGVVAEALRADPQWCAAATALAEALALVDRVTDDPWQRSELEDALRLTWDRVAVIPIDAACLRAAEELLRSQPVRLADALQFGAAQRLPAPVTFVSFDSAHLAVALGLGFTLRSP